MNQKVLVIDDSQAIHALLKARLSDEAVELHVALDGTAGMVMARNLRPDLILLDVEMPEPNGFEVCRRLKNDPLTSATPIIFLTGASSTEEKIRGLNLGAADYVTKPFDPAELRARVRASLRTKYLLDLLSRKAMIDGLTGLWNRAYLDSRLAAELSLSQRAGRPMSCMMIDVDHFKSVNDRFGHPFGDAVLRGLAVTIQNGCRQEDVVCRYGGEEFAVLLPNVGLDGAEATAERLRLQVEERNFSWAGQQAHVTCSFGVSGLGAAAVAGLIDEADRALYRAKRGGRNRVVRADATEALECELDAEWRAAKLLRTSCESVASSSASS